MVIVKKFPLKNSQKLPASLSSSGVEHCTTQGNKKRC